MQPPRADDDGGDPSAWRAALRMVARGLQVGGGALAVAAWVMVRGRYEIVTEWVSTALGCAGLVALVAGTWLESRALRTFKSRRDE